MSSKTYSIIAPATLGSKKAAFGKHNVLVPFWVAMRVRGVRK